jgi:cellulose synthase/poly-beta-1,6-N-acetylglucosamine synthase-like glycosyltransferase
VTESTADRSPAGFETPPEKMSALPSASVVIPTHTRPKSLKRCLHGVARQGVRPLEVLVVDNTRGEEETREVSLASGARYIVEPARGLSRARNRGAHEGVAEIVVYLDDDAIPERDWLAALLREFSDPLVGAVVGKILPFSGEAASFGGAERIVFDRLTPEWFERANFGGIGEGPNMAIRRSVFARWSGFDERLGRGTRFGTIGMEEHYAFFSLIDHGYRIIYTPAARVRHPFPHTEAELRARHLRQLRAAGFHLTLLLIEEPRYRRAAIRYGLQALRGTKRRWRTDLEQARPPIARFEGLFARLSGPFLYMLDRMGGSIGRRSAGARSES